MVVSSVSFSAQVDDWVRETEDRLRRVFRQSAQEVIATMQRPVSEGGAMPIDTGFLRASLQVSLNGPAPMSRAADGAKHAYNTTAVSLAIAGADIGDTIYATYTANYAAHVEYGAQGRAPRGFVRLAAAQWPAIVKRVSAQGKAAAGRA